MTRDFFVKLCSKNCPSVACKHAQIPGGDALDLTYNYDEFMEKYWNFHQSHRHRVRNVLPRLREVIAQLNAEKVQPTQCTDDIGGYLFALMKFERIMAPHPSAFFISDTTKDNDVENKLVFKDEGNGYNVDGVFDYSSTEERDDDSFPCYIFFDPITKKEYEIDTFDKCWKVIETLNKKEDFVLLSYWINKASLMKGAPIVSVKPIERK